MARLFGFFRSLIGRVMITLLTGVLVMLAGRFIYVTTTQMQNAARLQEMAEQTLLRAEHSADYAMITLTDLIVAYKGTCDKQITEMIGHSLYTRSAVKDLRILNSQGDVMCSGLTSLPEGAATQVSPIGIAQKVDAALRFHRIGVGESGLLGITWTLSSGVTFLAVLSLDSLMFDIFPVGLRHGATASLMLDDTPIARFSPDIVSQSDAVQSSFDAHSDRFSLSVHLELPPELLGSWNRDAEPYALGFSGLFGLIMGFLLSLSFRGERGIAGAMKDALARKEFVAHVQPVFTLSDMHITGGEVLARWQQPDGTLVPPGRFIGFAEECGLIVPMTWQVMDNALETMGDYLRANKSTKLGFNIVPDHLLAENFVEDLCAKIKEHKVSRRQIVIEITERQQMADFGIARRRVRELQTLGFSVSLDDTGVGHNGLSNVQRLGTDTIKIDKHFVDLIDVDVAAAKIVQMLVRLADDLGMGTYAEGIETESQLHALRECGVDKGQGFLVSPAVPPETFLEIIAAQPALDLHRRAVA